MTTTRSMGAHLPFSAASASLLETLDIFKQKHVKQNREIIHKNADLQRLLTEANRTLRDLRSDHMARNIQAQIENAGLKAALRASQDRESEWRRTAERATSGGLEVEVLRSNLASIVAQLQGLSAALPKEVISNARSRFSQVEGQEMKTDVQQVGPGAESRAFRERGMSALALVGRPNLSFISEGSSDDENDNSEDDTCVLPKLPHNQPPASVSPVPSPNLSISPSPSPPSQSSGHVDLSRRIARRGVAAPPANPVALRSPIQKTLSTKSSTSSLRSVSESERSDVASSNETERATRQKGRPLSLDVGYNAASDIDGERSASEAEDQYDNSVPSSPNGAYRTSLLKGERVPTPVSPPIRRRPLHSSPPSAALAAKAMSDITARNRNGVESTVISAKARGKRPASESLAAVREEPLVLTSTLSDNSQADEGREGRRARKSVNYALPNLNSKMRRSDHYVPTIKRVSTNEKPKRTSTTISTPIIITPRKSSATITSRRNSGISKATISSTNKSVNNGNLSDSVSSTSSLSTLGSSTSSKGSNTPSASRKTSSKNASSLHSNSGGSGGGGGAGPVAAEQALREFEKAMESQVALAAGTKSMTAITKTRRSSTVI